jgi:hypothetical protein
MALIPLNQFRTMSAVLTTNTDTTIYTSPVGVTSIVLMAQVANRGTQTNNVSFIHHRNIPIQQNAQGKNGQPGNTDSVLVEDYGLPAKDAVNLLSGKLVIETLDSVKAYASRAGECTLVLSILESSNQ